MKKKRNRYTPIDQRGSNDCGIAALAMLLGISYQEVHQAVLDTCVSPFNGMPYSLASASVQALGERLINTRVTPESRQDCAAALIGTPCVLVVPAKDPAPDGSQEWHAVFWSGGEVYDPSPHRKYGKRGIKVMKTFIEAWTLERL